MGKIVNVRIDGRLIHGQVCTQWVHQLGAKKIFIIDDIIAKDAFLSQLNVMAAPSGTSLEVITCEDAAKRWNEDQFGTNDSIFIIFQTLEMALKAYEAGFCYETLNFGTTLNKAGMVQTGVGAIAMNPDHAKPLEECVKNGLVVTFQVTPSESCVQWETVKKKLFPDL